MECFVRRDTFTLDSATGLFVVEDISLFFTLEDRIRGPGIKVRGKTAIPTGRYELVIDFSQRFGKPMPHVLNVPGFSGIRIHPGNRSGDTEGCLCVGMRREADVIFESRAAYARLLGVLEPALKREKVFVTYENVNPPADLLAAV